MNNLEWLYENDREALIDGITCTHPKCDECKFGKPEDNAYCALNEREWLLSEHANDGKQSESDVRAANVDANDAKASQNANETAVFAEKSQKTGGNVKDGTREKLWYERIDDYLETFDDSREKIDAEVQDWCGKYAYQADLVWTWLNRQADITADKIQHDVSIAVRESGKILRDENDRLKGKVDELKERVKQQSELIESLYAKLHESEIEREEYRIKFGGALDLANEILRMDD